MFEIMFYFVLDQNINSISDLIHRREWQMVVSYMARCVCASHSVS